MRLGTPLGQSTGRQKARVFVNVTFPGQPTAYLTWSGFSVERIKKAAREHYKGAKVEFGAVLWTQSWGAH